MKVPKLELAVFLGRMSKCLEFWSPFERAVDQSPVLVITKLIYLLKVQLTQEQPSMQSLPPSTRWARYLIEA